MMQSAITTVFNSTPVHHNLYNNIKVDDLLATHTAVLTTSVQSTMCKLVLPSSTNGSQTHYVAQQSHRHPSTQAMKQQNVNTCSYN